MNGWELSAQAIREDIAIRRTDWNSQVGIHFCNVTHLWRHRGGVEAEPDFNVGNWEIYTGAKPRVKMWQWIYSRSGELWMSENFLTDNAAITTYGTNLVRRADWTEIEIEIEV